jgi:C4-dicarboxylate-specific signal transduction histidine kinase
VRAALADIVTDGHRAGDVIQRMRQLASKSDPRKVRLDLNDVIHEVVALARSEVHKHRASLRLALAPALPPVYGDRVLLQQVVLNLVMNGVEAMAGVEDRPRELLIRSEPRDGAGVMVSIQDAGVGLDTGEPGRLFEPFFTTKPTGMGMGLSISRTIVEGHDGRLWATTNPEHGATFRFALPAARDPLPTVPAAAS